MTCPACSSTEIYGPFYGSLPGGRRRAAVLRCQRCRSAFDAYAWFGTGR